jgi:Resolvase, N terminal domain
VCAGRLAFTPEVTFAAATAILGIKALERHRGPAWWAGSPAAWPAVHTPQNKALTHRPARQRTLRAKGASLKATEQPIDTGTAAGKCFLDILGVFAEFETNLRRERQLEGIGKAKADGV